MAEIDLLEQQRDEIFRNFEAMRALLQDPAAQQLLAQMQSRASGQSAPFTQQVQSGFLADNADASAGEVGRDSDLIRQAMANAGLSGSGLETSALINSRRRASAATRRGRRDITSRSALANFQARERAQQQIQSFLESQAQQQQQALQQENAFRSRMTAEGDPANVAEVTRSGPGDQLGDQQQDAAEAARKGHLQKMQEIQREMAKIELQNKRRSSMFQEMNTPGTAMHAQTTAQRNLRRNMGGFFQPTSPSFGSTPGVF